MNPSRYWSPLLGQLEPYVPGEQPRITGLIKLNTNENPQPPSPLALAAIRAAVNDDLRLYPDPDAQALRRVIAEQHGLSPDQVFVGNGSDEVLAFAFQALLQQPLPILFPDITYSFYPVYCRLYGIDWLEIALTADFELRPDDYRRPNGGIVFPNPNAPTGRLSTLDAVAGLVAANQQSVVIVDEAYVDFGGDSAIKLVNRFANLLVVRTLSKSHSLAGLRVGFAIGHADLVAALQRVKNSFNSYPLDRLALAGAVAALEDQQHFEASRAVVIDNRQWLHQALEQAGFRVLPSAANFLFASHPRCSGKQLHAQLRARGILVRHFGAPRIEAFVRITIGPREHCQALVQAIHAILAAA